MSEADTPNSNPIDNSSVNFSDSHGDHPPSPLLQSESLEEQVISISPELDPSAGEESSPADTDFTTVDGNTDEPVTIDFAQESDWFVQARKQRQRNRELVKTVAQLEQALAEAQEALQTQAIRSQSSETLITQQAEELYAKKQQLSQIFQDLEAAQQTNQRQQLLIETLSEQLDRAQQQITILEEECSTLRSLEQQHAQQLHQAQINAEDLSTRLQYQQRQAQQFKAALDKCLESPQLRQSLDFDLPSQDAEAVEAAETQIAQTNPETPQTPSKLRPLSLSSPPPNPANWGRRIQPWSLQFEQELGQQTEDLDTRLHLPEEEADAPACEPAEATSELERVKLETEEVEATPEVQEDAPRDEPIPVSSVLDPPETSEEMVTEEEAIEPAEAINSPAKAMNWPSPTLSPVQAPKKRKSLAAVDLPSFPRFQ